MCGRSYQGVRVDSCENAVAMLWQFCGDSVEMSMFTAYETCVLHCIEAPW